MIGIYIRVSTQEQTQGYSIDEQKARLCAYCTAMGWADPILYVDPGYSGSNTDRPGLKSLIEGVKAHRITTVCVYKLDRLSRSQLDTLYLIEKVFLANGCQFVSVTENFDTSSPFGRAMMGILAVFAQLEREQIKERMQMGRDARAKEGLWHGCGYRPTGYDYENGELTVNIREAIDIREIFDLYAEGHTMTEISQKFQGKYSRHRIEYILQNPLYAGYIHNKKGVYPGKHEAIVTEETFQEVQRLIAENKKSTPVQQSLLGGMIWCARCGARYQSSSVTKYFYYRCHKRCGNKIWTQEKMDNLVLEQLKLFTFEDNLDEKNKEAIAISRKEKKALTADLKRLSGQKERLIQLYARGVIGMEEIQPKIAEIDEKTENLRVKIEETEKKAEFALELSEKMKKLPPVYEFVTLLSRDQQRQVLRSFIDRINIDGDDLDIYWKF